MIVLVQSDRILCPRARLWQHHYHVALVLAPAQFVQAVPHPLTPEWTQKVWGRIKGVFEHQEAEAEWQEALSKQAANSQKMLSQLGNYSKAIHESVGLIATLHPDISEEFNKIQNRLTSAMAGEDD